MCVLDEELLGTPEVSSTDSIPAGFCSQKFWRLTFLALEPWAVGPGVGLALLTPSLDGCGFSNSVVVRFPLNSISDSSE